MNYFSGRIHSIVYNNPGQDFYILRMILDLPQGEFQIEKDVGKPISVRGSIPGMFLDVGSWFGFEANWETHEKYGRQLVITKAPVFKDKLDTDTVCSMLQAHGVGPLICQRLTEHFKEKLPEALDKGDEADFLNLPGMTPFTVAHLLSRWHVVKAYFQTLNFLNDAGIPKHKIAQVWGTFGDKAEEVLSSNPWALVQVEGIQFAQADEVALRLGLDMNSPLRVRGAVLYACKEGKGMGHLYLTSGDILNQVQRLIGGHGLQDSIAQALVALHKEKLLYIDRKTKPGFMAVYEPWNHTLEVEGATLLKERLQSADASLPLPLPEVQNKSVKEVMAALAQVAVPYQKALSGMGPKAEKAYTDDPQDIPRIARAALEDWSAGSKITLSPMQLAGALNALVAPVSVLTGLPGSGKSTTLIAVVSVLKDAHVPILLVAPTGIAAKRMQALTGHSASTIHRAFGAKGLETEDGREATYVGVQGVNRTVDTSDGSDEIWTYGPGNPHPARVVVIDESSMLDQHMLYRVLTGTDSACRLVFVGDAAQLPSVGAGNVLRTMIASNLFPTVALTEIFRQDETSDIVLAAHQIHRGRVPSGFSDTASEFLFQEMGSEESIVDFITKKAIQLHFDGKNFQVLSPRHGGILGVTNLNQVLREALNPKDRGLLEMKLGNGIVREQDKIMVVKNNYELGIYNGDMGQVARIDRKASEVEIRVQGPPEINIILSFKEAMVHLRLAYAVTCHKSQGQEFDTILMPIVRSFRHQLQRNLLYTGITRAKKQVYLLGQKDALAQAVMNNKEDIRNTLFLERLVGG